LRTGYVGLRVHGNTRQRGKGSRFLDDTPPYAFIYRLATCVRVEREWDQDPQADTRVEKGTVVRVQVGRERIPRARARARERGCRARARARATDADADADADAA